MVEEGTREDRCKMARRLRGCLVGSYVRDGARERWRWRDACAGCVCVCDEGARGSRIEVGARYKYSEENNQEEERASWRQSEQDTQTNETCTTKRTQ